MIYTKITKENIYKIISDHSDAVDVLYALYCLPAAEFPNKDSFGQDSWVNKQTWDFIRICLELKFGNNLTVNWLWKNEGFKIDDNLETWLIRSEQTPSGSVLRQLIRVFDLTCTPEAETNPQGSGIYND